MVRAALRKKVSSTVISLLMLKRREEIWRLELLFHSERGGKKDEKRNSIKRNRRYLVPRNGVRNSCSRNVAFGGVLIGGCPLSTKPRIGRRSLRSLRPIHDRYLYPLVAKRDENNTLDTAFESEAPFLRVIYL